MLSQNAIVISIEGLSTTQVGAYGSNTSQTKAVDAIAARGIVLDQCFLDSRQAQQNLLSLWTATHAITRQHQLVHVASIPAIKTIWQGLQAEAGVLVTDCTKTAELAERVGCSRVVLVEAETSTEPVEEVTQCQFFSLQAAAAEVLEQLSSLDCPNKLLWIHSRGLRLPWDAPTETRSRFKDADDPDPPTEVGPPLFQVDANTDPDVVLGWTHAAAAQVMVFDEGIEFILDLVEQLDQSWAWCVLGLNAYPLGEHGWIGDGEVRPNNHQLQVVAILSPQPPLPIGWRVAGLCQLPDIGASIAHLCGIPFDSVNSQSKSSLPIWGRSQLSPLNDELPIHWEGQYQSAVMIDSNCRWLRAPAWSLLMEAEQNETLFVQPDDHWEVNEVGSRCQDVIEELREACNGFVQAAQVGRREQMPKLNEVSCNLLR
ncbi:MAG: hypothetical protein U0930_11940 [Pirellulales bacterium]